jgi:hypothetical protein
MEPIRFDQATDVLGAPQGKEGEIGGMPIYRHPDGLIVSCWKLSEEELEEVKRTGIVWLWVMGPDTYPLAMDGISPWGRKPDEAAAPAAPGAAGEEA